jgi:hypothetical protein
MAVIASLIETLVLDVDVLLSPVSSSAAGINEAIISSSHK